MILPQAIRGTSVPYLICFIFSFYELIICRFLREQAHLPGTNLLLDVTKHQHFGKQTFEEVSDNTTNNAIEDIPTKLVGKRSRIQFTCDFKELLIGGRTDLRGIKTFVSQIRPHSVIVLSGGGTENFQNSINVANAIQELGISACAPNFLETMEYDLQIEKFKVLIPQTVIWSKMNSSISHTDSLKKCLTGYLADCELLEVKNSSSDGIRLAKLKVEADKVTKESFKGIAIGAVSTGDVSLETIQERLEFHGISVEYKLVKGGGTLVCDGSVIIRKDNENEFVVEGAACRALVAARKALYDSFTFL